MGIADQVNALRRAFPECRVATFADLASGLVLFTSSDARLPQERLDALCDRARALLDPGTDAAAALLGAPVRFVATPDADGTLVIVRAPEELNEALICHCDPDLDLAAFAARAARDLSLLGQAS